MFTEDLSAFFDTDGHALDATYNSSTAVKVIFDAAYQDSLGVAGNNPVALGEATDFVSPIGKLLAIGTATYVIRNRKPVDDGALVELELEIADMQLTSVAVDEPGTGYAPAQVLTLAGGTFRTAATATVTHTQAVSAAVVAGGTGGTPGAATITGTTGTGTKFQATGTIGLDGILAGALVVSVAGDYTVNPTVPAVEPVTGGGLTGCTVAVGLGVLTVTLTGGIYSATSATLTQSGATVPAGGTGATFDTAVFAAI